MVAPVKRDVVQEFTEALRATAGLHYGSAYSDGERAIDRAVHEVWYLIPVKTSDKTIKVHRFQRIWGEKIKVVIGQSTVPPSIAEMGGYDER